MTSKRYKGKDCAYCGTQGASTTADHVIAREFFFEQDRGNLPQVPACKACNNKKSALEHYATAALMAGSNHTDGDLYRRKMVAPRLARNKKLQREMGINNHPIWINVGGIIQLMHVIKLDHTKINNLMALIAKGLYYFHFGKPLTPKFWSDVSMIHPEHEPALWASMIHYFPADAPRVKGDFGRGSFFYEGAQSTVHEAITVWRMTWHGGIRLYGADSPPQGVSIFWAFTRPTPAAVAAAKAR